ncbi:APC family permease [Nocardioides eburneiflavus]|uniref:APC family permease n=1 Tax=Nocardioides eburneiflavus TaxID=2518372 RepID=A0A4Z1CMT4_9ACTN|nr:APC family permease [Nocardioides eburneiflavus]TGN65779.1 APC family permease [Nocardioides eburneiflavus]
MSTTTPSTAEGAPARGLKPNALGTSDLVFIVVAAAAPLMVMVGVAPLAIMIGGIGAPAAYVFAGVTLAIFAVGFTTMSRHLDNAGAFYSYIAVGLGRTAGVIAALVALVSYNALQIGVYGLAGVAIQGTFAEVFGIDAPWWVYAIGCILIVWYVGFRTVDFGAKFLAILLTAETALLLILAVAVVVQGGSSEGLGLDSFAPSNMFVSPMTVILPTAFAAFMGFEATVIYRSETRNPRRTIPRATYVAVAVLAGTYAFIVWAIVQAFGASGAVGAATETGVGMFFVAGETYVGSWFTTAMHLLIATSVVASLVAFHNAVTRYAVAISEEGLLPRALANTHSRTRSPYVAGAAQTMLALVIVAGFAVAKADPYSQLLIWVNTPGIFGILLLQVAAAISVVVFFRRRGTSEKVWSTVVAPIMSAVLMIVACVLAARNISFLTGTTGLVNQVLLLTIPVTCVIGFAWALWLRRNRRDVFDSVAAACETAQVS